MKETGKDARAAEPDGRSKTIDRVAELIDRYKDVLDEKDRLAEETKANNALAAKVRDELAQAMLDAEITQVGRGGITWRLKPVTKYSKKAGADDELFDLLRERGLGSLIRETVNAQTLQGAMSELAAENDGELPEEFSDVISVYEYMDISRRKFQ